VMRSSARLPQFSAPDRVIPSITSDDDSNTHELLKIENLRPAGRRLNRSRRYFGSARLVPSPRHRSLDSAARPTIGDALIRAKAMRTVVLFTSGHRKRVAARRLTFLRIFLLLHVGHAGGYSVRRSRPIFGTATAPNQQRTGVACANSGF
jgi:hypothetical protein